MQGPTTVCDFVLMGATGFIGSKMLEAVAPKYSVVVVPGNLRLHERTRLHAFLNTHRPRHGVICCSGTRGSPNIDWCDMHPAETVEANVTGQLNVVIACRALGLHCVLIGTGFVYAGLEGKVYTEEDPPDSQLPKTYIKLRILLERLLLPFDNVLNLRVIYPITRDLNDKCGLIGKLASFTKVDAATNCCTFLEDLCPLVPLMAMKQARGSLNFVNPGAVSYAHIVERLKSRDPSFEPELRPPSGRPAIQLDCSKMIALCAPEARIPTAAESLENIFAGKLPVLFSDKNM
mmetsp:Transcript_55647/g.153051  ORF Transcript_55647/g.153051 Transcript_55647/m.153051 type:complete len:290 (+) Transcript_55647:151-1020(+)